MITIHLLCKKYKLRIYLCDSVRVEAWDARRVCVSVMRQPMRRAFSFILLFDNKKAVF